MNIYIWHHDYSDMVWRMHAMEYYVKTFEFWIAVNRLELEPMQFDEDFHIDDVNITDSKTVLSDWS